MFDVVSRGSGWIGVQSCVVRQRLEVDVIGRLTAQSIAPLVNVIKQRQAGMPVLVDLSECYPTPAAESAVVMLSIMAAADGSPVAIVGIDFALAVEAMPRRAAPAAWFQRRLGARRWLYRAVCWSPPSQPLGRGQ